MYGDSFEVLTGVSEMAKNKKIFDGLKNSFSTHMYCCTVYTTRKTPKEDTLNPF